MIDEFGFDDSETLYRQLENVRKEFRHLFYPLGVEIRRIVRIINRVLNGNK
jgi:hypothetical protein